MHAACAHVTASREHGIRKTRNLGILRGGGEAKNRHGAPSSAKLMHTQAGQPQVLPWGSRKAAAHLTKPGDKACSLPAPSRSDSKMLPQHRQMLMGQHPGEGAEINIPAAHRIFIYLFFFFTPNTIQGLFPPLMCRKSRDKAGSSKLN